MKQLRTPQLLNNLYRDMRDRRMLLPAIALVVALIAVPVMLKSSPASAPPPAPAPTADAGEASATQPAVVSEQLGVTDYRKRLDQLQTKNPFRRHFTAVPDSSKLQTTSSGAASSTTATTSGSSTLSSSSLSGASLSGGSSSFAPAPPATSSGSGSGGTSSTPSHEPASPRWFSFRVSVAVGPAGDLTERKSVKRLTFLPGDNRPLVAFVGVTEDAKRAIFVVSDDVSSVRGDGRCAPDRGSCSFVELRAGDRASLRYAPEGNRAYTLKLEAINLVRASSPHAGGSHKLGSAPVLGPDG